MGLFEPAVLAAGINQLFKLPQKRPRGPPLCLCLGCIPTRPVGAIPLPGGPPPLPPCKRQTRLPRIAGARQGSLERRHQARQRGAARASTKAVLQSGL